jgi:hypothetical protein
MYWRTLARSRVSQVLLALGGGTHGQTTLVAIRDFGEGGFRQNYMLPTVEVVTTSKRQTPSVLASADHSEGLPLARIELQGLNSTQPPRHLSLWSSCRPFGHSSGLTFLRPPILRKSRVVQQRAWSFFSRAPLHPKRSR